MSQAQINLPASAFTQNQSTNQDSQQQQQAQPQQQQQAQPQPQFQNFSGQSFQLHRESNEVMNDNHANAGSTAASDSNNATPSEQNGATAATGSSAGAANGSTCTSSTNGDHSNRSQPTQGRTRLRGMVSVNIFSGSVPSS